MKIDRVKLYRQLRGGVKFIQNGGRGTLEWCTGMGKTFISILLILKMQKKNPGRNVVVIVPTIQLKEQWEKELGIFKVQNTHVYVINTIVLSGLTHQCSFLILDEIHRFASDEFIKVFQLIEFRFILGLTATIKRLDGKHTLLLSHAPVVDTITLTDARTNKWISEYLEFNFGVPLDPIEEKEFSKLERGYHKYFSIFGYDFDLARKCQLGKAKKPGQLDGPSIRQAFAQVNGWDPIKDSSNKQHVYHPDNIAGYAQKFGKYMRARKEFLYNCESKLKAAQKLSVQFKGKKILSFGESVDFADRLTSLVPGSGSYHSGIKSETVKVPVVKSFKTTQSAEKYYNRNIGVIENLKHVGLTVKGIKNSTISPSAVKRKLLEDFEKGIVTQINSAKSLDQGTNIKDIEIAIICSRTSNPTQQIQRIGRSTRKFTFADGTDKVSMIINLYSTSKNVNITQDEKWLTNAQKDLHNPVIWTENPEDISLTTGFGHNDLVDETEPE